MSFAVPAVRIELLSALGREKKEARARDAFEALVAHDWDRFHRYALRLCHGNADDAEDLLSETMLDAFRAFASYRGSGFDRWFFRMLTTNRIDMSRRAAVRRALSLDSGGTTDDGAAFGVEIADPVGRPEQSLDNVLSEAMQRALDDLPDEFRIPVLLCDVEDRDYEEISAILNLPLGTVKSRIHRGRSRLRASLEALGWPGG